METMMLDQLSSCVRATTLLGREVLPTEPSFQPDKLNPLWGNPCDDIRHGRIRSKFKWCDTLPKALVIGPQKTGITALYTFLAMHASLIPNMPSPTTDEELQFSSNNNYLKGWDWYLSFFPPSQSNSTQIIFETSVSYFDGDEAPRRLASQH